MERSVIRGWSTQRKAPHFASLHAGYACCRIGAIRCRYCAPRLLRSTAAFGPRRWKAWSLASTTRIRRLGALRLRRSSPHTEPRDEPAHIVSTTIVWAVLIYRPELARDQVVGSSRWQPNLTIVIIGPMDHRTKFQPGSARIASNSGRDCMGYWFHSGRWLRTAFFLIWDHVQ